MDIGRTMLPNYLPRHRYVCCDKGQWIGSQVHNVFFNLKSWGWSYLDKFKLKKKHCQIVIWSLRGIELLEHCGTIIISSGRAHYRN